MKNDQGKVFLKKINEKIKDGEYDSYIDIPFMSKELIFSSIKARINKKVENNATPLLNENEIKDAIKDAKETALISLSIFVKLGLIKKEDDKYIFDEKYKKLVKAL